MSKDMKYISLDEVVETAKKENKGGWAYTMGINWWVDQMMFPNQKEEVKTEDADFEIIPNEKKPPKLIGS
jgi:hypothetical protein